MPYTPNSVTTQLFSFNDFIFTMAVSGTVVDADLGKAVALDTTAPNTVKLAADGDVVYGRLETLEKRLQDGITVGAVARRFRAKLPKTGAAITIGASVVGGGAGLVKAAAASEPANTVIEVGTDFVVVEKL